MGSCSIIISFFSSLIISSFFSSFSSLITLSLFWPSSSFWTSFSLTEFWTVWLFCSLLISFVSPFSSFFISCSFISFSLLFSCFISIILSSFFSLSLSSFCSIITWFDDSSSTLLFISSFSEFLFSIICSDSFITPISLVSSVFGISSIKVCVSSLIIFDAFSIGSFLIFSSCTSLIKFVTIGGCSSILFSGFVSCFCSEFSDIIIFSGFSSWFSFIFLN